MGKNFLNLDEKLRGALKGKVVVVTGAGSGLGKAISFGLPFAGAKIGCLDLNEKAVQEVSSKINTEFPNSSLPLIASVTDEVQLEKAYSDLQKHFGSIDVLVNCAGIARLGAINELLPKDIRFSNDVNLNGYFLNASIASRHMIETHKKKGPENGCSIINISSASARGASENSSLYGVSKEAQCMMARSWAVDLGKYGIRVNTLLAGDLYGDPALGIESGIWNQQYFEKKAIDKGLIKTDDPRLGGEHLNPEIRKMVIDYYAKRTALGKQITYMDVIELIVLLCSDLCSKITGESIPITAGNPTVFSR